MVIRTYISITTSNINGLNTSTKRQTIAEWIKKTRPVYIYMLPTKDSLQIKTYTEMRCTLKLRQFIYVFYANGNKNKAKVIILISYKITDFWTQRERERVG